MSNSESELATIPSQQQINAILANASYQVTSKLADTLQGQIWCATRTDSDDLFVVKLARKHLHEQKKAILNNRTYRVHEDILSESSILKYLSSFKQCPSSIIQFEDIYQSNSLYFLIEQNGGSPMFPFVVNVHRFIQSQTLHHIDWLNVVRVIFSQMVDAIDFMHSKNICHFDISLENMTLLNDLPIVVENGGTDNERIRFIKLQEKVKVKIIDFGLAEQFEQNAAFKSSKYCGKSNYESPELVKRKVGFNAAANDIWCAGVCLFMLVTGCPPFDTASKSDASFCYIMDGQMRDLLSHWNLLSYFDEDLLDVLSAIFKPESSRISASKLKAHKWLQPNNSNSKV